MAGDREVVSEKVRKQGDRAKIKTGDGRRGQRVGDAPPKDDVDVHQPVVHDGVAKGEGQEDQREYGNSHPRRGNKARGVRQRIKRREGSNRHERSARGPLQLLLEQR